MTQNASEPKWTPGPWSPDETSFRFRGVVRGPNREYIAKVNNIYDDPGNMALICAVPALMAAAGPIVEEFGHVLKHYAAKGEDVGDEHFIGLLAGDLRALAAAYKLAKGETDE